MNQIVEWVSRVVTAWKFWVIVSPWEVGLRVRLGREAIALKSGPHWRIPFLDEVLLVNIRERVSSVPTVTLSCETGVRCLKGLVGYQIADPLRLCRPLSNPPSQSWAALKQ